MKKLAMYFTLLLAGTTLALADSDASKSVSKDMKKLVEEGPYVETSQKGITLSGYVDAGYFYNFSGRGSDSNGQLSGVNRVGSDNMARGDFNLNAMKIALEKPLSDANELQAGFRTDIMMGEDVVSMGSTNSVGVRSDNFFVEQAYVQFRLPYGNGIDFKVGKFVSILGYEAIERPVNINITYGSIFRNLPLWHTGFLSSYKVNDNVDLKFGVVNGNNVDNGVGNDAEDNAAILAAVNFTIPEENVTWYNAVEYAINGWGGWLDDAPLVIYDTYINWTPKCFHDHVLFGVNFDLGNGHITTNTAGAGLDDPNTTTWWGFGLYGKYKFTDVFSMGERFGYVHNDDSNTFGNDPLAGVDRNEDLWNYTATADLNVIENMMFRLEYRIDWGKDLTRNFTGGAADGTRSDGPLHTAVAEVVYSF